MLTQDPQSPGWWAVECHHCPAQYDGWDDVNRTMVAARGAGWLQHADGTWTCPACAAALGPGGHLKTLAVSEGEVSLLPFPEVVRLWELNRRLREHNAWLVGANERLTKEVACGVSVVPGRGVGDGGHAAGEPVPAVPAGGAGA